MAQPLYSRKAKRAFFVLCFWGFLVSIHVGINVWLLSASPELFPLVTTKTRSWVRERKDLEFVGTALAEDLGSKSGMSPRDVSSGLNPRRRKKGDTIKQAMTVMASAMATPPTQTRVHVSYAPPTLMLTSKMKSFFGRGVDGPRTNSFEPHVFEHVRDDLQLRSWPWKAIFMSAIFHLNALAMQGYQFLYQNTRGACVLAVLLYMIVNANAADYILVILEDILGPGILLDGAKFVFSSLALSDTGEETYSDEVDIESMNLPPLEPVFPHQIMWQERLGPVELEKSQSAPQLHNPEHVLATPPSPGNNLRHRRNRDISQHNHGSVPTPRSHIDNTMSATLGFSSEEHSPRSSTSIQSARSTSRRFRNRRVSIVVGKEADPQNRFSAASALECKRSQQLSQAVPNTNRRSQKGKKKKRVKDLTQDTHTNSNGDPHSDEQGTHENFAAIPPMVNKFGVPNRELWYDEVYGFIPYSIKRRWDAPESANSNSSVNSGSHGDSEIEQATFPIRNNVRCV